MKWTSLIPTAAACLALVAPAVQADDAPDWQTGVLAAAADLLEPGYIYEDRAHELAAFLREDPDRYAHIVDPDTFARAVTADFHAMVQDAHLRVFHDPEVVVEATPETPDRRSACASGTVDHDILADNVGYMRVPSFRGDESYVAGVDAAFAALAETDALVLDLRNNCGGGPHIVRHISTYLFADLTHLASTEMRGHPVRERWTYDDVPGARYLDRPVLVLTNGRTFSAAESFTFGLKATGRVLTVGERTGGGGHFGGTERLSPDFTLFIPVGRTFDPRTGEGWEAEGIEPDLPAVSDNALDAALTWLADR
ncbi:S41 family peptidase [Maricaulis maris]|uniref:S41 family peptidase n=1 Tax=Maricaulis maris TaxID=74318 RepID=UPI003B8AD8BA